MIRLFLKLYGVLIATLALSFVVQMQVMDYAWRELAAGQDQHLRFRPGFRMIDEDLARGPADRRQERLAQLSATLGTPVGYESLSAIAGRHGLSEAQRRALEGGSIVSLDRDGGGSLMAMRTLRGDGVITLQYPGPGPRGVKFMIYAINWAVEFALVAVLVFFWVRPFWRDLRALHAAADAVGGGRFDTRVSVGRFSPLRSFAAAFNAMAARISSLVQSHRSLTSAISHELRTPLSRLRFSHSLARDEPAPKEKDRFLARMERDIAQIDELTTELLGYARLERESPELHFDSVPAAAWLEDVLVDSDPAGAARPPVVVTASIEARAVRCEPRYMARAVANLIRNARTHARSTVLVSVRHEGGRTVIDVDDDGTGIGESDRERVFEPFVRLDRSRSRDSGGFGLGLAIARQIARWHGGEARVSGSPLGGARVSITW